MSQILTTKGMQLALNLDGHSVPCMITPHNHPDSRVGADPAGFCGEVAVIPPPVGLWSEVVRVLSRSARLGSEVVRGLSRSARPSRAVRGSASVIACRMRHGCGLGVTFGRGLFSGSVPVGVGWRPSVLVGDPVAGTVGHAGGFGCGCFPRWCLPDPPPGARRAGGQ